MTDGFDRARVAAGVREIVGPSRVQADAPLAPLTTFGVGGPADWLVEARTIDEVGQVVALARSTGAPLTILGGGSNVLISDAGLRGIVLRPHLLAVSQTRPDTVRAESGVTVNGLVRWTIGRGLAGLEAWAGTPGTVGGAIYGNAHFGGIDIGTLVRRVGLIDRAGARADVPAAEMGFAYDTSRIQGTGEIVLWAEFSVTSGVPSVLRETARASLAYRKRTQPLALASAGCVFQNPSATDPHLPPGVPASAGALVDRAGLKGASLGGARISPAHGNFVVSEGQATAADVRALVERARVAVRDRFGVELKYEVVFLGEFPEPPR